MPPEIDSERCSRCGGCVESCPNDVFYGWRPGEVPQVTYPDECWHCGACVEECGTRNALSLRIPLPLTVLYKPEQ